MGRFNIGTVVMQIWCQQHKMLPVRQRVNEPSENAGELLRMPRRGGKSNPRKSVAPIKIDKSTDNIAAYSDLSISYKKLGDSFKGKNKKSAWGYYEKCCEIVRTGINKINTDEIEKLEIKAQLYYNAGMARYALADMGIDKAKNYKSAQKNYENAKFNAEKAEIDVEPYERALDKL